MRPIQQLYFEQGQLFCPVHGRAYVRFMSNDQGTGGFHWCCDAILPNGEHCLHSAEWASLDDIEDDDVRTLTQASTQRSL